jgi:hypothetical protein
LLLVQLLVIDVVTEATSVREKTMPPKTSEIVAQLTGKAWPATETERRAALRLALASGDATAAETTQLKETLSCYDGNRDTDDDKAAAGNSAATADLKTHFEAQEKRRLRTYQSSFENHEELTTTFNSMSTADLWSTHVECVKNRMIDVTVGVFVPYLLSEGIRIFPTFFSPRQTFSDTFFPLPGACGARSELVAVCVTAMVQHNK